MSLNPKGNYLLFRQYTLSIPNFLPLRVLVQSGEMMSSINIWATKCGKDKVKKRKRSNHF